MFVVVAFIIEPFINFNVEIKQSVSFNWCFTVHLYCNNGPSYLGPAGFFFISGPSQLGPL